MFARRIFISLALLLGFGLSWWLWSRSPAPMDDARRPERVILFAPNLTESAWALGYGELVVGITDFCVWPPELLDLPRIGGMIDPNLERLAALSPDLLVVQGEAKTLRDFSLSNGIPLASVKMDDDVDSILRGLARLDSLLGGSGSPALIGTIRDELAAEASGSVGDARPSVLLSLGHDPHSLENLYAIGSGTFFGELLELVGARNQYADTQQSYFLLNLESLVADPPDIVFELKPGQLARESELRELRDLWSAVDPALRAEWISFDGTLIPGPRIGATARAFRRALEGDAP